MDRRRERKISSGRDVAGCRVRQIWKATNVRERTYRATKERRGYEKRGIEERYRVRRDWERRKARLEVGIGMGEMSEKKGAMCSMDARLEGMLAHIEIKETVAEKRTEKARRKKSSSIKR
ncbi:hypothetical protein ACH5RR_015375 [Cinchona calisaya]|uniref:Uncharacterized protein n=1 Tax=Cinchona calisaya TaxID=153742 RepID=A0ABD2ZSY9_9GENT